MRDLSGCCAPCSRQSNEHRHPALYVAWRHGNRFAVLIRQDNRTLDDNVVADCHPATVLAAWRKEDHRLP